MVSLWGASSLIKSVQHGSIATTSASATATISAVATENCLLIFGGEDDPYATGNQPNQKYVVLSLTNSTTVTQTRNATDGSNVTSTFCVIEFMPGVVKSVQYGSISLVGAVSNTATITGVNTAKSIIVYMGQTTTVATVGSDWNSQYNSIRSTLTSSTVVTAVRRSDAGGVVGPTVGFGVLEFF